MSSSRHESTVTWKEEEEETNLLSDLLPDDPGHLVSVELNHRIRNVNLLERRRRGSHFIFYVQDSVSLSLSLGKKDGNGELRIEGYGGEQRERERRRRKKGLSRRNIVTVRKRNALRSRPFSPPATYDVLV